jgi:hypothetical protein
MAFGIKWLRPEIDEPKYYVHLVVIAVVTLFLLDKFVNPAIPMLTIKNVLWSIPLLLAGDTVAHTILQLD